MYPPLQPRLAFHLHVDALHALYVEECGNPDGLPVVLLHGGPGGGISTPQRRFFDPALFRIVLFDQRGAGKSTPGGEVTNNTTAHLVDDLESIRRRLGIERWVVFGGSWGSLLALAYAQRHPERVIELILRGLFLGTDGEIDWLNERSGGARWIFPERWSAYEEHIAQEERAHLVEAYWRRLDDPDRQIRAAAAAAWLDWTDGSSTLVHDPRPSPEMATDEGIANARIEAHYFRHGCFLDTPLLDGIDGIRHIPATLVQGRYDIACPMQAAHALKRAWPELDLRVVLAGHSAFDDAILQAVLDATARCADRLVALASES
ncbi:prolyl aminopeptidase [Lysobacter yangpyeongensis]|uniref:Proline iminopeptidase n=1 Tax=Lysobacter yangpyeongensis TaxID=346182 RepID=A0ABW0SN71_9GAMM